MQIEIKQSWARLQNTMLVAGPIDKKDTQYLFACLFIFLNKNWSPSC
jgi:hypothetical protein